MLLDPILFSYRVTRQSSTKYSPYFMMFGRHPRLPIDAEFDLNEESYSEPSERDIEQAMENLVKIHKDITAKATVNISEAQKVQKDYYDRKHTPILMNKGAKVLIENTAQRERKGGKLCNKWLGPYIINRHIGKGIYELQTVRGTVLKKKYNLSYTKSQVQRKRLESVYFYFIL